MLHFFNPINLFLGFSFVLRNTYELVGYAMFILNIPKLIFLYTKIVRNKDSAAELPTSHAIMGAKKIDTSMKRL